MNTDILTCIKARTDFFEKYYTVPTNLQPEVDAFVKTMNSLGEQSSDAQDFEAKFASNGLQNTLNSLIMRCTPMAYQMTETEKAHSKEVAKEIFHEDRGRIIKEAAADALDTVTLYAEEELIAQNRKQMIEKGVYDDYTRTSNKIEDATRLGGFLGKLFKKKK